ncbi:hypothetical protein BAZSYMA_ACONTIG145429_0 [Bathymodiolus azoricus thioautotrophic gill symbiont]|uniref:Uncharacterized protein n=1 Tax=Bathymodiolus azoricus thioautotrophic gill symbiont TaxID=235205 RepID=A0A1H6K3H9_9GAMM|nr:hypothetical protein BAZSYMA_ACONTIG145429_0 [Bathymodiolus azoricus thioautotrophic gill symbiont]
MDCGVFSIQSSISVIKSTSMFVAGSIFVTGNTSVLVDIDMGLAKQF